MWHGTLGALSIIMDKLAVGSLNVKGMMDYKKRMDVKRFIQQYDIMLLQETHGWRCTTAWLRNFHKRGIFSFYSSNARGSGILINDKCDVLDTKKMKEKVELHLQLLRLRKRL